MSALSRLPPAEGLAAMQQINITVINPHFLGVFMGTAALSLGSICVAATRWGDPVAWPLAAGGVLYFVGCFLVTVLGNVPLNEALAKLDAANPESHPFWGRYLITWTRWNHLRTAASLAAALLFCFALATGRHCFGCTAGAGSSCGGALA
jgi:uncharacterized membrane protein